MLSWLMFVASGIGPYSGQAVHFRTYAPKPNDYAVERYTFEAQRHWNILEARLGKQRYMCGDAYTIVDMAVWGWSRLIPNVLGPEAAQAAAQPAAPPRRDQRAPGGGARAGAEGQAQLQDRDGRVGAPVDVPASGEEGRLTPATDYRSRSLGAASLLRQAQTITAVHRASETAPARRACRGMASASRAAM